MCVLLIYRPMRCYSEYEVDKSSHDYQRVSMLRYGTHHVGPYATRSHFESTSEPTGKEKRNRIDSCTEFYTLPRYYTGGGSGNIVVLAQ